MLFGCLLLVSFFYSLVKYVKLPLQPIPLLYQHGFPTFEHGNLVLYGGFAHAFDFLKDWNNQRLADVTWLKCRSLCGKIDSWDGEGWFRGLFSPRDILVVSSDQPQ
jgi:hypothetical protein